MLILDTFLDGRTAYFFETNPAGLMGDGLVRNTGYAGSTRPGTACGRRARPAARSAGRPRSASRSARSTSTSRPTRGASTSSARCGARTRSWCGPATAATRVCCGRSTPAGSRGLRDVTQGVGLEVVPYGAAVWRDVAGQPTETLPDAGIDVNYSVTPNLRAAVTVNTDFAEAEVDRRRVNLTRFPLFYPEQRDFFLESASIFEFAPLNAVNPYFSRRIGLDEGQIIPIEYGARLAGQAGAYDVGFLQVRTGPVGRPAGRAVHRRPREAQLPGPVEHRLHLHAPLDGGVRGAAGARGPAYRRRGPRPLHLDLPGRQEPAIAGLLRGAHGPGAGRHRGRRRPLVARLPHQLPERRVAGAPLLPRVRRSVGSGSRLRAAPRVPARQSGGALRAAARLVRRRAQPGVRRLPRAPVRPPQPAADARYGSGAAGRRLRQRRPLRRAAQLPLRAAGGTVRDSSRAWCCRPGATASTAGS